MIAAAVCVPTGVVILVVIVVIVAVSVFLISRRNKKYKRTDDEVQRVRSDAVEDDGEPDGVEHASTHTSDERERLLRQRTTVQRDAKNRLVLDYLQELHMYHS